MELDLNDIRGRTKAAKDGEWKKFLADRYWLHNVSDKREENLLDNYGPPYHAP